MKKIKTVKSYQRKTKSGKVITVKQHTAGYEAAQGLQMGKAPGKELEAIKSKKTSLHEEISPKDFEHWYHLDHGKDEAVARVEKVLKSQMGEQGYKKLVKSIEKTYSDKGHKEAFKAYDVARKLQKKESPGWKSPEHREKAVKEDKKKESKPEAPRLKSSEHREKASRPRGIFSKSLIPYEDVPDHITKVVKEWDSSRKGYTLESDPKKEASFRKTMDGYFGKGKWHVSPDGVISNPTAKVSRVPRRRGNT